MIYPTLPIKRNSKETVDYFRGYNHNLRIGAGEFYRMTNMTSDLYPVLSPRVRRGVFAKPPSPQGLIAKNDTVCYVDGTDFVMGDTRIFMDLATDEKSCPKQLVSMGAYVIIMPDKKYINTIAPEDFGEIESVFASKDQVTISLCTLAGDSYNAIISPTEPENPENLAYWLDTSVTPQVLKQWSETSAIWVSISTTYVKIETTGIGKHFQINDGINLSGLAVNELNGNTVIRALGDDFIVIQGVLDAVHTQNTQVKAERVMPILDFMIESGNRLWGCRYGTNRNGETVNEIYASKLGDFRNWNCFMGISTDSYIASCGTDGPFTGAITHMGYPLFFKENCVHKVYGSIPADFQIQNTACRGVQKGCHRSLAIVNETLFYKARSGICSFDGSLPSDASYVLGKVAYSNAVAGSHADKYYVSMQDRDGNWHLFVLDTSKKMWHREDNLQASDFCSCGDDIYCIDAKNQNIITLLGSGEAYEKAVQWEVETGEIGMVSPEMKYISQLLIRLAVETGSELQIYVQYDMSNEWIQACNIRGTDLRSISVPIRPRRCDHMKMRIKGTGPVKIYGWTKTIAQGSDRS